MTSLGKIALLGLASCRVALATAGDTWRDLTIYQIMTDRFARTDGSTTATCDTGSGIYCGGSWQGIIDELDYVQGMGFDAIWISPITYQLEGNTADGEAYHGYWQQNINELNSHFGSEGDLQNIASAVHSRNMYLMVDVVVNHYAWAGNSSSVDYSVFGPFNNQSYFHPYCAIDYNGISNTTNIEQCWMGDQIVPLPDLRTEDENVYSVFDSWIAGLVSKYSIDGLRIDSAMEVDTGFWSGFQSSANVYSVGEVYNGDSGFVCSYQDYLPGVMNYAMYFPMVAAFSSTTGSIGNLANMIDTIKSCPDTSMLGTFSENHDQPRFASLTSDMSQAKNVMAFTMLTDGIPIIYQGQEQHYQGTGGGGVPYNREALWLSGFNTDAELYTHVKKLNAARHAAIKADSSYTTTQNKHIYNDYTNIAMQKGEMVTVLTNVGVNSDNYTLDIPSNYTGNAVLTELLTCETLTTSSNGSMTVPMSAGVPRVYYPTSALSNDNPCSSSSKQLKRSRLFPTLES